MQIHGQNIFYKHCYRHGLLTCHIFMFGSSVSDKLIIPQNIFLFYLGQGALNRIVFRSARSGV